MVNNVRMLKDYAGFFFLHAGWSAVVCTLQQSFSFGVMVRRGPAKMMRDASRSIAFLAGACGRASRVVLPIGPPPGLEGVAAHPCAIGIPSGLIAPHVLTIDDLFPAKVSSIPDRSDDRTNGHVFGLLSRVSLLTSSLADAKESYVPAPSVTGRQRYPLPLPAITADQCRRLHSDIHSGIAFETFLAYTNASVFGLNALYGLGQVPSGTRLTPCQTQIISRIMA